LTKWDCPQWTRWVPCRPCSMGGALFVGRAPQTYRILKFLVCLYRLDSIFLTEGTVMDPRNEIGVTLLIIWWGWGWGGIYQCKWWCL